MFHKIGWFHLVIVQWLMVKTLLPVHVEGQQQENYSINITIQIDIPEGFKSTLTHSTFDSNRSSIHHTITLTSSSHKNIVNGNNTLNDTEHKETTHFANRNDTAAETIVMEPLIIFTKFTDETIVTTLGLLILILLQDHVLSDILSHQLYKLSILATVVSLFSLLLVALVNFFSPDSSNFAVLLGFCVITVHSRSYLIWIWRSGFTSRFCNISNLIEITRILFFVMVVVIVHQVRNETDIFKLIKWWFFIYLLAFSVNYLLILDATFWYLKRMQIKKREEKLNDRSKYGIRGETDNGQTDQIMNKSFDEKFKLCLDMINGYTFFMVSSTLCFALNVHILSAKEEDSDFVNAAIITRNIFEVVSVLLFWLLKYVLHLTLIQIKETFLETHQCVYHSTEDIVGFGINLLNWISPTFGSFDKNNYQKHEEAAAQFFYNRFACTGSVLYQNWNALHFIHLVMTIAFLSIR